MEFEYVCYPNLDRRVLSSTDWVKYALNSLVHPSEATKLTYPWYQTSLGQAHIEMTGRVAGEFYRLEFDSKSDLWRLPRYRDPELVKHRKLVHACALLWAKTWRVLERMESMGRLPLPPHLSISASNYPPQSTTSMWLMALVLNGELLTPWQYYLADSMGFEALRKQLQNDNKMLRNCQKDLKQLQNDNKMLRNCEKDLNPFATPYTRLFIDLAIETVGKFDQFGNHFYNPMVRQRQSVTALMVNQKFKAFDMDGKPSRQGRLKKLN